MISISSANEWSLVVSGWRKEKSRVLNKPLLNKYSAGVDISVDSYNLVHCECFVPPSTLAGCGIGWTPCWSLRWCCELDRLRDYFHGWHFGGDYHRFQDPRAYWGVLKLGSFMNPKRIPRLLQLSLGLLSCCWSSPMRNPWDVELEEVYGFCNGITLSCCQLSWIN